MTLWFTSDQHFGHEGIIKHQFRPFASVDEMNSVIIHNFNSIVRPTDTIWHLGDFALIKEPDRVAALWGRLMGHHHFLCGNHDNWFKKFVKEEHPNIDLTFHEPLAEVKWEGQKIIVCHYALAIWRSNHKGHWHLHGHSHGNYRDGKGKILDVGVDNHRFFPVSFSQVKAYMAQREIVALDHHSPKQKEEKD